MNNIPPIRRWLLDAAERMVQALGPATVTRIVLPPLAADAGKDGEFCAVQLDCGSVGLSFALLGDTLRALHARRGAKNLPAADLIAGYAGDDPAERVLGLATLNALTHRLYERAGYAPDHSTDSFGSLGLRAGDHLGMIGHFTPLIEQAREQGIAVTVLELRGELVREEPGLTVTLDPQRLAACNKIVSTSTLLLNDTFETVCEYWRQAESVTIVGPSAGGPPDPFFAAGVSSVGTVWVDDPESFLERVATGMRWRQGSRKITLTPDHYPGFETLLARAR